MNRAERRLLDHIAKVPAGERLPMGPLSRIFGATQSVTVTAIEALITSGHLDRETLRPPVQARKRAPFDNHVDAAPLVEEIDAFLATGRMTKTRFVGLCMRSPTALPRLRKSGATVKPETAARIRAFINEHSQPGEETPRSAATGGAEPQAKAPDSPVLPEQDRPTGAELADEVQAFCARKGWSKNRFARQIGRPSIVNALRNATHPRARTVAAVRAFIASGGERDARNGGAHLEAHAEARCKVERQRDICETRHARHQRGIRDVVEREASEREERHRNASRLTTAHPLPVRRAEDEDDADIGTIAADRREREFRDVAKPSDLIRRAQAEWPDNCAAVKALAAEIEITLAEAWQRVIAAGIECLNDPEAV